VTRKELAAALGCAAGYINKLRAAGRLVLAADGKRYMIDASRTRIAATRDPAHQPVADRHAKARGAPLAGIAPATPGATTAPPTASPSSAADAADEAIAALGPSYADARARRVNADAQLREMDLRKRQGQIIERDDAVRGLNLAIIAAAARLDTLADTIAPQAVGIDDEVRLRAIVAEAVLIIRRELARDFNALLLADV